MNPGKLYLIPPPLGDTDPAACLPQSVLETACGLRCFVVEELRTARRFLSRYGLRGHIDELDFHVLNEHTTPAEVEARVRSLDQTAKYVGGGQIVKVIVVPGKIVNIVVK